MKHLLIILIFLPLVSFAQKDWELKKYQNDIKVYVRGLEDSPLKEIMVKMKTPGTLKDIKELLLNVENHKDWVYNTKEAYIVKKVSPNEVIYYTEVHLPWPVSNRDVNAHMRVKADSIPNVLFVKANSITGTVKPKSGVVRVTNSRSQWKITQTDKNELLLEYVTQMDPGGNIPPWFVNATAINGPYYSFSRLKELLIQRSKSSN